MGSRRHKEVNMNVLSALESMRERGWLLHLIPWEANGWRVEAFRVADTIAGYAVQHNQLPIVNKGASTIPEAMRLAVEEINALDSR